MEKPDAGHQRSLGVHSVRRQLPPLQGQKEAETRGLGSRLPANLPGVLRNRDEDGLLGEERDAVVWVTYPTGQASHLSQHQRPKPPYLWAQSLRYRVQTCGGRKTDASDHQAELLQGSDSGVLLPHTA